VEGELAPAILPLKTQNGGLKIRKVARMGALFTRFDEFFVMYSNKSEFFRAQSA